MVFSGFYAILQLLSSPCACRRCQRSWFWCFVPWPGSCPCSCSFPSCRRNTSSTPQLVDGARAFFVPLRLSCPLLRVLTWGVIVAYYQCDPCFSTATSIQSVTLCVRDCCSTDVFLPIYFYYSSSLLRATKFFLSWIIIPTNQHLSWIINPTKQHQLIACHVFCP